MRPITFLVAILAVVPFTALTAQERPPFTPGVRVRVTTRPPGINRYDGTLAVIRGDTLVVDTVRVALMSVTQLDVYQGRKSHVLPGLVIGLVTGAGAGAIIGDLQDCGGSDIPQGWCAASWYCRRNRPFAPDGANHLGSARHEGGKAAT